MLIDSVVNGKSAGFCVIALRVLDAEPLAIKDASMSHCASLASFTDIVAVA